MGARTAAVFSALKRGVCVRYAKRLTGGRAGGPAPVYLAYSPIRVKNSVFQTNRETGGWAPIYLTYLFAFSCIEFGGVVCGRFGFIDGVAISNSDPSLPPSPPAAFSSPHEQDMTKGFFDDLQNMVG